MTRTRLRCIGGLTLAVAATLAAAGCSSSAAGSSAGSSGGATNISLGATMELTGAAATTGIDWSRGIQLGVKEANGTQGFLVDGKRYKWDLDMLDNQSSADQSIANYHTFIGNGTKFIFGPTLTSSFIPAFNSLGNYGAIVMVAGGVPTGTVIKPNQYVFTTLANAEPWFSEGYAKAVIAKDHPKTVAILLPQDYSGTLFVGQYTKAFESAGVKVVLSKQFPDTTTDFAPYVSDLKAAHPDLVVSGYLDTWVQPLMQQAVQAGFTSANWMMSVGDTEPVLAKFAGPTGPIKAIYNPLPVKSVTNASDPQLQTFRALWTSTYGSEPDFNDFNALANYDPVLMLTKAIEQAGTVSNLAAISDELVKVKTWPGQASSGGFSPTDKTRVYPINYMLIQGGQVSYFQAPSTNS